MKKMSQYALGPERNAVQSLPESEPLVREPDDATPQVTLIRPALDVALVAYPLEYARDRGLREPQLSHEHPCCDPLVNMQEKVPHDLKPAFSAEFEKNGVTLA